MNPEDEFDKKGRSGLTAVVLSVVVLGACGLLYLQGTKPEKEDHDTAYKPHEEFNTAAPATSAAEEVTKVANPFESPEVPEKHIDSIIEQYQASTEAEVVDESEEEPLSGMEELVKAIVHNEGGEDEPILSRSGTASGRSDERRKAPSRINDNPITRAGQTGAQTLNDDLAALEKSWEQELLDIDAAVGPTDLKPKRDIHSLLGDGATTAIATGNRKDVLGRGTLLPCVLETTIHTDLPGLIRCVITKPVYSDNGQRLLLPRGTIATGDYEGGMKRGVNRVFVRWTRLRTPNGAVVNFAAPGIGPMGASGLAADLDRHYKERFGSSVLLSIIGGLAATESNREGSPYGAAASSMSQTAEIALRETISLETTGHVEPGVTINIMVKEDILFTSIRP